MRLVFGSSQSLASLMRVARLSRLRVGSGLLVLMVGRVLGSLIMFGCRPRSLKALTRLVSCGRIKPTMVLGMTHRKSFLTGLSHN
jgi:hypothetical protein